MSKSDARGAPTSTDNDTNLASYERAVQLFHRYRGDPVAEIDSALAEDPGFVMGHVLRGHMHVGLWERGAVGGVREALDNLEPLAAKANEREQAHVAALTDWAAGDWNGYRARLDRLLAEYPRDALALQMGHLADFFHGDRDNLRGRVLRAMPAWDAETPSYSFLIGWRSFGLEECGDYGRAEEAGRHALSLEPDDCWAHHAVVHVMEMQARQAEGTAFIESRRANWAQDDNTFAFHNWWHLALYYLDNDDGDKALALYDSGVRPGQSEVQLEMADAAALLWRLHLRSIDVGKRWEELAAKYEEADEDAFYAFNDMHAMAAYAATGRDKAADALIAAAERAAQAGGTNATMTQAVGLPVIRGFQAFGQGRYGEAVNHLMPVRYNAHIFGGSHAQRDIIHRTLIEAAIRGGERAVALALTHERTALKPHCPFGWKLQARAAAA